MSNITDDPFEQLEVIDQPEDQAPQGAGKGGGSLRDQAIKSVPQDRHAALLLAAADAKVGDPDDPSWWLIAAAVNIESAAKSVSNSEIVMNETLAQLPGTIQKAAISAGDDLRGVIEQAGVKIGASAAKAVEITASAAASKLVSEVDKSTDNIKRVVSELPLAIERKRDEAVQDFANQAATAALEAVKAAKRRGFAWAGFTFILVLALGAVLGVEVAEHLHIVEPITRVVYVRSVPQGFNLSRSHRFPHLIRVAPAAS